MSESARQSELSNIDARITGLVAQFASKDGLARQAARKELVLIGTPAVGALIEAAHSPHATIRWEAVKALGTIQAPAAAPALVEALNDNDFGVRWLAAEGLIALRHQGLPPLLKAISEHPDTEGLRESVHLVIRVLADDGMYDLLAPVLYALDHGIFAEELVMAAQRVLQRL